MTDYGNQSPDHDDGEKSPRLDFSMVIASAVHDMKNSLGMLLHTVEELREEHQNLNSSNRFNTLQYEAERVHSDLVQLLGIYRLGEHKLSAHSDEHFVADFLAEQMARHEQLLKGYGIVHAIHSPDITGYFDADLLAGVITNTLNNAIRYTRTRVRLSAREEDGYLILGVEDDGAGYPIHMQEAGALTLKTPDFAGGSTSLGLYFASAIARLHHNNGRTGFIKLHNNGDLGGGVFELWLP